MTPLTGKQRRFLRGLGHHLSPVVQVGQRGVTDAVCGHLSEALDDHELVKLRLTPDDAEGRKAAAEALAGRVDAHLVQVLGNTVLLYRPRKKDPEIRLPAAG